MRHSLSRLQVKGMGEKQIEVDRRLLKGRMARLRKDIEEVGGGAWCARWARWACWFLLQPARSPC